MLNNGLKLDNYMNYGTEIEELKKIERKMEHINYGNKNSFNSRKSCSNNSSFEDKLSE